MPCMVTFSVGVLAWDAMHLRLSGQENSWNERLREKEDRQILRTSVRRLAETQVALNAGALARSENTNAWKIRLREKSRAARC